MATRVVFLDFGSTLVEPPPEPYRFYQSTLHQFGIHLDPDEWLRADLEVMPRMQHLFYETVHEVPSFFDRVDAETLKLLGIPDPEDRIVNAMHSALTSPLTQPPYAESEEVLKELYETEVPMHIVSNNTDLLLEKVARLGWTRYFASVTFSQEVGAEKPDRRVFEQALRRAGCEPADVVHVGDSWEADYVGAKKAGLRGIWLNRDGANPPEPCEMILDLREVPRLLTR